MRTAHTTEAARPQLLPAFFAAGLSVACILALHQERQWGFYLPPRFILADGSTSAGVGACLASVLAVAQTVVTAAWAPWAGSRAVSREVRAGRGASGLRLAAVELSLLFGASAPIAIAAWLSGGWDVIAILGLYVTNVVLGGVLASLGAAVHLLFRRARMGLLLLSAGCLLTLGTGRITSEPGTDSALAFLSPGYGLTLFFRGSDPTSEPPPLGDWLKHLAAMVALGSLGGSVAAVRRRRSRPPSSADPTAR
jgi:hypothetical protein